VRRTLLGVRILVADDESALLRSVERSLTFEGYDVLTATDGEQALRAAENDRPELIVLDVTMPVLDGLEVCRRLRARGDVRPVLMLTARDGVSDRVAGLDAGADDYLVKPFAYEELLARLRALRRRLVSERPGMVAMERGPLRLDPEFWEATIDEVPVSLTRTEYLLLEVLLRHHGQVLSRPQMYRLVWDDGLDESSNAVEIYVGYLRRKLDKGGLAGVIHTVRGVGYTLRIPA
jgi:two-component system response regulator MprA